MSWNRGPDIGAETGRRRYQLPSIALRMTLWYALSAFALISVATGLLYWVLTDSLYQEHFRDLADNLNNARLLLRSPPAERRPSGPA